MTFATPKSEELDELLEQHAPELVATWVGQLRTLPGGPFALIASDEIAANWTTCLEAYRVALRDDDYGPLDAFIERTAQARAGSGFHLSELQYAFLQFKHIVWPKLAETYQDQPHALIAFMRRIDAVVDTALMQFSESFQREVNESLTRHAEALEALNRELHEQATRDGLTGLFNHRHFEQVLPLEFERARRYGHPMSIIMADIDLFKQVNDRYGHAVGDQVLRGLATILTNQCRTVDIVTRYGGEEFAIILPDTRKTDAERAAERLRRAVGSDPIYSRPEQGLSVVLTVSFGVSGFPEDAQQAEALLDCADQAMYEAKRHGRNRVAGYRSGAAPLP